MAFFKFRKGGEDQSAATPQPESIETMRRRAKHRLLGAAVLVLAGVIGFPILFDRQPRPISVDMPIEIPDKTKVKPLAEVVQAAPTRAVAGATPVAAPATAPTAVSSSAAVAPAAEKATPPQADEKVLQPPTASASAVGAVVARREADGKAPAPTPAAAKVDEAAKAQALLDGKEAPTAPPAAEGRFVVQVGAFSDAVKAREARLKVERAGLKTYTQVVETKDGRRTRVRVGPFADRAGADEAVAKIKKLDMSAAVLVL
ncbi:MAG: SPOR domain-containing protein [Rhodoferax sp.]|nr:SPOR domain-containing protein [Rhodoferax sp.]